MARGGRDRRHLRADPAGRGRRPGPARGASAPPRTVGRATCAPACWWCWSPPPTRAPPTRSCGRSWSSVRARRPASTSTWPSPPSGSTRATRSTASRNTPKVVGGYTPACTDAGRGVLRPVRRHGGRGPRHPRGGDGQAAGEHLPARQHRAGQRDGAVLPRAGHRPVGRDPRGGHQAVRLPGVLPRPGRRRALHPDRPELPRPQRPQQARLPVPLRRAGPGDQRHDAGLRGPARAGRCSTTTARRSAARRCCCSASPTRPNIADQRESPADAAGPAAARRWAPTVAYHDPHVPEWLGRHAGVPACDDLEGGGRGGRPGDPGAAPPRATTSTTWPAGAQRFFDTRGVTTGDTAIRP